MRFLQSTFVLPNVRSFPQAELVSMLQDVLFALREQLGPESSPKWIALRGHESLLDHERLPAYFHGHESFRGRAR